MSIWDELSLFTSLNNLCQSHLCHSTHVYSSVLAVDFTSILSYVYLCVFIVLCISSDDCTSAYTPEVWPIFSAYVV